MSQPGAIQPENEELWRGLLAHGHPAFSVYRKLLRRLPSSPRCKLCCVPYAGFGGRVARLLGYAPSRKNPSLCDR